MNKNTATANAIAIHVMNSQSDDIREIFGLTPERAEAINNEMATFLKQGELTGDSFNQLAQHFPDPNEFTYATWCMGHGIGLGDADEDAHTGFGDQQNPLAALFAALGQTSDANFAEGDEDDNL